MPFLLTIRAIYFSTVYLILSDQSFHKLIWRFVISTC